VPGEEWIFTFGQGHVHPATAQPLERRFVRIEGDHEQARKTMTRHFGQAWGNQYRTEQGAGVRTFGLLELKREDWPPERVIPGLTVEDLMDDKRIQERDADRDAEWDRYERQENERY
jgi:hypothetical protein